MCIELLIQNNCKISLTKPNLRLNFFSYGFDILLHIILRNGKSELHLVFQVETGKVWKRKFLPYIK